ncbi:MAG: KpsF/GutQ family sugar-phosphate isomerase [Holosporales bacterium]|jgi:arabinose-5-phosphate isomerase|nr:KpsF/GutQ family sugar-phosphate isomerase [Holosporales bacterium]
MMDLIDEAKRTITEEAEALLELAQNVPNNFSDAVKLILNSSGRLVVSGIGKSGHIGRKISSTMSSFGQMSFFIHPSEAPHGDLGMIDPEDILLLISYSGESVELLPIIEFGKRIGTKIISISGSAKSTLSENSDIALHLPAMREACPFGVAPTVSSTATLALGDALAVALLSQRCFSREQFKELHPGGALGRGLSFAFDVMRSEMPLLPVGKSMQQAILTMTECNLGCVGIIDEPGHLIGIITDGDLRRHMSENLLSMKVEDVMTINPVTVSGNMLLVDILKIMEDRRITNVFVLKDGSIPLGIIHIHDIIVTRKVV